MYAWARKSRPMPPYSGGRCGAHSPASHTFALIFSRSSWAARRWASVTSPPRWYPHNTDSLGRMSSFTIWAVCRRISLMRSSSAAIGFTFMTMARLLGSEITPTIAEQVPELEAPAGDRGGHDPNPVRLAARSPRVDLEVGYLDRIDLVRDPSHEHAPADAPVLVEAVGLEAHGLLAQTVEFRAVIGPEHDGSILYGEVHGHDQRRLTPHADRESTDVLPT